MNSRPILLQNQTDYGCLLDRIEVQTGDEKSENWLQALIFNHPEILPVTDFDESFGPAIPVGREITTTAGNIDNLYVSPSGSIIIVETKLWKNPEKHRTVVAQVIDYAKEISKWDYDQLNASILKAARSIDGIEKKSLEQLVTPYLKNSGISLLDFQERIISTLENGDFLLLIIGDRISPNLALLSESISGAPGLNFRLGLIELKLYQINKNQDWPLLVIPDIVGKTVEKTRGVIKVQYISEKPRLIIDVEEEEKPGQPQGKTTKADFLNKAPDDLSPCYEQWLSIWQEMGLVIYWGVKGFSLRININGKLQTILEAYPEWALSLIREPDLERLCIPQKTYMKYLDEISSIPIVSGLVSAGKKYIKHEGLTSENLMVILQATTDVIRPILEK